MSTYAALNLAVLSALVCILYVSGQDKLLTRRWFFALSILFALTIVFDSLIIHTGIVAYDKDKIMDVYLWLAPVEDFAYTIGALLLAPLLWHGVKGRK